MTSVSIIGVGRVGGALAIALPKDKYGIDHLIRHNEAMPDINSDIVFITTHDSEIVPAAKTLAGKVGINSIVYHTCGAQSSTILESVKLVGCPTFVIISTAASNNATRWPQAITADAW